MKRLGTDYGGWWVDLDAIDQGTVVIDAGIGKDDSFSVALKKARPDLTIIQIDPANEVAKPSLPGVVLIRRALTSNGESVTMYSSPGRSDSIAEMPRKVERPNHLSMYRSQGLCLLELLNGNNVDLVKLDIEGCEFEGVFEQAIRSGVPQIACEFHIKQMPHRQGDFEKLLRLADDFGYVQAKRTETNEITFLKKG